ncbi:hypothetical protein GCM10007933_02530 [Zoogloea oryzae]|uniref:Uncharacterized protein n=1 Tax=Zoogloea oryzae TaxID=310767 RepID=A0ABQ6F796_9RHOO|nr:hypothetical protein GCM10007933_02530 [Zoogloea oryzae]
MTVSRLAWRRIRIDADAVRRLVEDGRAVLRPADPVPLSPPRGCVLPRTVFARVMGLGLRCPWGSPGDLVDVRAVDVWGRVEEVGVEWDCDALWWRVVLVRVDSPAAFRPTRAIPRRGA